MEIISIEEAKKKKELILQILHKGGLVVFPTETCYGVGCDATNDNAVSKLLELKKRPEGRSIPVCVSDVEMAREYIEFNSKVENTINTFTPGPVTIVAKSQNKVDKRLESEKETLGIRISSYSFMTEIVKLFTKPIVTTLPSSSTKIPYKIEDLQSHLSESELEMIDLIIDAGELPKNPLSTVIDLSGEDILIHRKGFFDPTQMRLVESKIINSEAEMISFSKNLFSKIFSEQDFSKLILLNGELGAGKTHFTKGFGELFNLRQIIKSPTYNYFHEYKLLNEKFEKIIHFDAWRVNSIEDLKALRVYSWFEENYLTIIEWPSVLLNFDENIFNQQKYYYIDILVESEGKRKVRVFKKD